MAQHFITCAICDISKLRHFPLPRAMRGPAHPRLIARPIAAAAAAGDRAAPASMVSV